MDPHKQFLKHLDRFSHKHQRHTVFSDFITMASSALIVRASPEHAEESEAEYMAMVPRYTKEELVTFGEMLALVAIGLQARHCDFLGQAFMQAEISNAHLGQFFTPYEVSYLLAKMTLQGHQPEPGKLITVQEPACGSGGMVVAFAQAATEIGIDVQWDTYTVAVDISEVAARMAYIQLSMLNIPAHVVWGDTLRMTERRAWPTMAFWPIVHKVVGWRRGEAPASIEAAEPQCFESKQDPPAPASINLQPCRLVRAELF